MIGETGNVDHARHTPIPAELRDKNSPVWDMSQERVFIEQLLNQRFNFFLVIFSLVIAGCFNAKSQPHLLTILIIGAIGTTLLASALARSQEKLDIILEDLSRDPSHPATIINSRSNARGSRRRLIGIWIPRLCCLTLITGALLASVGANKAPPPGTLTDSACQPQPSQGKPISYFQRLDGAS